MLVATLKKVFKDFARQTQNNRFTPIIFSLFIFHKILLFSMNNFVKKVISALHFRRYEPAPFQIVEFFALIKQTSILTRLVIKKQNTNK